MRFLVNWRSNVLALGERIGERRRIDTRLENPRRDCVWVLGEDYILVNRGQISVLATSSKNRKRLEELRRLSACKVSPIKWPGASSLLAGTIILTRFRTKLRMPGLIYSFDKTPGKERIEFHFLSTNKLSLEEDQLDFYSTCHANRRNAYTWPHEKKCECNICFDDQRQFV